MKSLPLILSSLLWLLCLLCNAPWVATAWHALGFLYLFCKFPEQPGFDKESDEELQVSFNAAVFWPIVGLYALLRAIARLLSSLFGIRKD